MVVSAKRLIDAVCSAVPFGLQVVVTMQHGQRSSRPLQYAAARAAFWALSDVPNIVESLLFPDNVRAPVRISSSTGMRLQELCTDCAASVRYVCMGACCGGTAAPQCRGCEHASARSHDMPRARSCGSPVSCQPHRLVDDQTQPHRHTACNAQGMPLSSAEVELVGRLWAASAAGPRRSIALDDEPELGAPMLSVSHTPWAGSGLASANSRAA